MLRVLGGGDFPRLSVWVLNPSLAIHIREKHKEKTHAEEKTAITTQAETGVMRPQAKESRRPPAAGRGKE